jgi:medium-chain acyl-[acyl-carrier-protein] hydrolase
MDVSGSLYEEAIPFRSAEIGPKGTYSLYRLVDTMQETAGNHAHALGFGMTDMASEGLTWALVQIRIQLLRHPDAGVPYRVQTWPCGVERLWAFRRYRFFRDHEVLGQATTRWMVLHRETHRPARLPERLVSAQWPDPHIAEPEWYPFPESKSEWSEGPSFRVRMSEIDINRHVNNAHYLAWAMHHAPDAVQTSMGVLEANLTFEAECSFGDTIQVKSQVLHQDAESALTRHQIRSDAKTVSKVELRWVRD